MFDRKSISKRAMGLLLTGILGITFWSFSPILDNDFVNFDDNKYLTANPLIMELSPASIKAIFSTMTGLSYRYVPLTLLSFAVEHHFFGLDPWIYQLDNLLLHLLNTGLTFLFIWLLCQDWLLAAVVSVLFGVHPMHVESVAWVSERKDVLYTFFYLLGLIQYVFYVRNRSMWSLTAAWFLFVLACFSKLMAITFPFVLWAIDYYLQRNVKWTVLLEKLPFLLVTAVFAAINQTEYYFPVIEFDEVFTWFERFLLAAHNFYQYIFKAIVPVHLSVFHPYPARISGSLLPAIFYWAPLISAALMLTFVVAFRRQRGLMFGALFFTICIGPVLNFVPVGNYVFADRYSYLSYLGLFFILAEGIRLTLRSPGSSEVFKKILVVACVGFIGIFSFRSHERADVWQNSEALWDDAIKKYPREPMAYYNLGNYFFEKGNVQLAIMEYSNAIMVDPRYFAAHNNRGNMYFLVGRYDLALQDYLKALELNPHDANARTNVSNAKAYLNQSDRL